FALLFLSLGQIPVGNFECRGLRQSCEGHTMAVFPMCLSIISLDQLSFLELSIDLTNQSRHILKGLKHLTESLDVGRAGLQHLIAHDVVHALVKLHAQAKSEGLPEGIQTG